MGTWQKNKFHQLIFVNCFEIHWWKETWTENKKCQLLKFVCWIFHLWIYIYRISSHLLNYHLPILFRFLPLFLCTDGTLVIFLFTRGFVNTKERQVTSNRSYRHAQFEFATSSLSLCRQFKPLKRIHRTFFLLDTVYLSVSESSWKDDFISAVDLWFLCFDCFLLAALLYSCFAMGLNEEYVLQMILPMRLLQVMGKPWQLIWSSATCSVCSAFCEDLCSSL